MNEGGKEYSTCHFESGRLSVTEYIPVRSSTQQKIFSSEITELCLDILREYHGRDADDRNILPSVSR